MSRATTGRATVGFMRALANGAGRAGGKLGRAQLGKYVSWVVERTHPGPNGTAQPNVRVGRAS
jgi:hypothetical protein